MKFCQYIRQFPIRRLSIMSICCVGSIIKFTIVPHCWMFCSVRRDMMASLTMTLSVLKMARAGCRCSNRQQCARQLSSVSVSMSGNGWRASAFPSFPRTITPLRSPSLTRGLPSRKYTVSHAANADQASSDAYDVVVVGGGVAGAALALRLAQSSKMRHHRIAVVEGQPPR